MLHISAIFGALYFLSRIFFQFYNLSLFILIFAVTGIVGGLSSVIILPQEISYGASSSVLGILGFLISFILKFSNIIPKNFINEMLTSSILFIVFLGIVGFNYIDNTANLGGFVAGLLLGATLDNRNSVEAKKKSNWHWHQRILSICGFHPA
jgi:membrane associated rhomboid family serine protease